MWFKWPTFECIFVLEAFESAVFSADGSCRVHRLLHVVERIDSGPPPPRVLQSDLSGGPLLSSHLKDRHIEILFAVLHVNEDFWQRS